MNPLSCCQFWITALMALISTLTLIAYGITALEKSVDRRVPKGEVPATDTALAQAVQDLSTRTAIHVGGPGIRLRIDSFQDKQALHRRRTP